MPVSPEAVKQFLDALNAATAVTSKKMFGGVGVYADGIFFAVIDDDRLFFKVAAENAGLYDEFSASPWVIPGNPPSVMPYREVPPKVLTDQPLLASYIKASVAVATRKKSRKK